MKSINKSFAFLFVLCIAGFIYIFLFNNDENTTSQGIGIGVADDMSGFVIDFIIKEKKMKPDKEIKPFFIRDC